MRHAAILLIACPLLVIAQPAENDRTLQTLLGEVQQLRMAIERSTLLGTRTQLAISQLQLQEGKAERLSKELNAVRESNAQISSQKARFTQMIKEIDAKRTLPEFSTPQGQSGVESEARHFKHELETITAAEQRSVAREGELASQVQTAQREVQDSRSWISEMQRSLDAAIQQMLKPR